MMENIKRAGTRGCLGILFDYCPKWFIRYQTTEQGLSSAKNFCFWLNKVKFIPSLRTAAVGSLADSFKTLRETSSDCGRQYKVSLVLTDSQSCLPRLNCNRCRCVLVLGWGYLLDQFLKFGVWIIHSSVYVNIGLPHDARTQGSY